MNFIRKSRLEKIFEKVQTECMCHLEGNECRNATIKRIRELI